MKETTRRIALGLALSGAATGAAGGLDARTPAHDTIAGERDALAHRLDALARTDAIRAPISDGRVAQWNNWNNLWNNLAWTNWSNW